MARSLHGKAASVKIVDLVEIMPDLPKKGDVSDFLDRGGTVDQLMELAMRTAEWKPSAEEQADPKPDEDQSHAGILKRIAATAELFKTPAGDGYATHQGQRPDRASPGGIPGHRALADLRVHGQEDRAPSGESLAQIVSTIKARALSPGCRDPGWDPRCT